MTKHKVKSSSNNSKKMNSKTWLIGGIAGVIVLIVLAVTLYSPIKGAMFGKAVGSGGEISCNYGNQLITTEYVDASGGYTLGKSAVKGCCPKMINIYGECYSPSTQECYGAGFGESSIHSNFPKYLCVAPSSISSSAKWYVCDKNKWGIVQEGLPGPAGPNYDKYVCAKEGWVNCNDENEGKSYLNYVCHDFEWTMFTTNSNPKNPTFSDLMNFNISSLQWIVKQSAFENPTRMGECSKKNQCITKGGDCKDFGFLAEDVVCGYDHQWLECTLEAKGVASSDRKYLCGEEYIGSELVKWLACDKQSEGIVMKFMGKDKSQCKNGYWIDLNLCKGMKSGEKCIFSETVVKTGVNKLPTYTFLESAEPSRIGIGKGKQCLNANHKAVNYDTAYTSPEYICGDNNRWVKCTSEAKNVVSDGGNFICDGSKWQKINNQKKGCSNCASSEFCVVSHLYPSYSVDAGDWVGWELPYDSKRVGCSSDSKGCADTNGVGWVEGSVKDNKYICSYNKWYTCSESSLGKVAGSYFFCAAGDTTAGDTIYAWIKCDSEGYLVSNKQTLCTNEGWHNCIKTGISDADSSWLCVDGKGWSKCDSSDDVEVAGLYTCDGKSWTYNFVDFSGGIGGGGKTGPLSSGNTEGTTPATKGPR